MSRRRRRLLRAAPLVGLVLALGACSAAVAPSPSPSADSTASPPSTAPSDAAASPGALEVTPAPGSSSALFAPNPAEIVVAVEAGHGGCLDWGVPDPQERGPDYAEKAITMAIARALAGLLSDDGANVVLVRDGDQALAGDRYPPLGCDGAPFRDVNGDGLAGFGPDLPEATRTRDELQARLDRANLAGADILVSIHVDSITDAAGTVLPIARTETFYTDETAWGIPLAERLAAAVQGSLVTAMDEVAGYERQDRGINAHNLYIVAPPLDEPTPDRLDPLRQPTRGALMPAILVEVGSITHPQEHELLLDDTGALAAARGILDGLRAWFAERELAGRIRVEGSEVGRVPAPRPGDGLPFVAEPMPEPPIRLRITNTGTAPWGAGARLVVGWIDSGDPYLYGPPDGASPIGPELPALEPGESVVVELDAGDTPETGSLAWFSLSVGGELLADHGSPALQLRSGAP